MDCLKSVCPFIRHIIFRKKLNSGHVTVYDSVSLLFYIYTYFILVFNYKVSTPHQFFDDELGNEFLSYVQVDMVFYVGKDLS